MKRKIIFLSFYFTYIGTFFSQSTNFEKGEVFIEIDKKYVESLEGEEEEVNQVLSIDTFKERFNFLNENTALSIDYNDVTYTYVKKYLSYFWYGKIIGLSTFYFPLFESKLEQYGMPKELKYLAVVESGLNPRAGSWAGAKGLWQFMPITGAELGIRENEYVNIFYDSVGNTDSAVRYLRDLHKQLGDWNLAISAYNCGPGNVRKAIRKAGSRNYWKIRPYLPKETQAYVPSFIAVNYLFNFYKSHNIKPRYFKFSFFDLKMIKTNKTTTFEELGKEFNYAVLKFANPQFLTNIIPKGSIVYVLKKNREPK